ncbi:MAG: prepilin-type N-terminal cleavage/methylation domain-containing protein [Planctomycetes bacterium]|nr:prepilin-type N-terminal cleavage/methylation domain-containing protein [Planctomycetota bacterium]
MEIRKRLSGERGFTLIELLVVVAVIALLVGLLSSGMSRVVRLSKNLKQKSIFHGIETGLELFSKDFGGYPDSGEIKDSSNDNFVCGAHHLAEALIGRDERGFDPRSKWYAPESDQKVYANTDKGSPAADIQASLNRRKQPYIELRDTPVLLISDLYEDTRKLFSEDSGKQARVLTDVFARRIMVGTNSLRVGTPILYFKANTSSRLFRDDDDPATAKDESDMDLWIYDFKDNREVVHLGPLDPDPVGAKHFPDPDTPPVLGPPEIFYERITNPNISLLKQQGPPGTYYKPYNPKTFILLSAGHDGIFGTRDDVSNFNY